MDTFNDYSNKFDTFFGDKFSFLNNQYVSAILIILLISYSSFVAPKLSMGMMKFLDNGIVKVIFLFLIVFFMKYSPSVSLIAAVAVLISMQAINKFKLGKEMFAIVQEEKKIKGYNVSGCKCASAEPEYEEPIIPVIPSEVPATPETAPSTPEIAPVSISAPTEQPIIPSVVLGEGNPVSMETPISGVFPGPQEAATVQENVVIPAESISSTNANISGETAKDEVIMTATEIEKKIGRPLSQQELANLCVKTVATAEEGAPKEVVQEKAKELFRSICGRRGGCRKN